jgi:hypothetical protein
MPKPKFNPLRDLISGCIMAATSVPQLLSYAETSGYASYRYAQKNGEQSPFLVMNVPSHLFFFPSTEV